MMGIEYDAFMTIIIPFIVNLLFQNPPSVTSHPILQE